MPNPMLIYQNFDLIWFPKFLNTLFLNQSWSYPIVLMSPDYSRLTVLFCSEIYSLLLMVDINGSRQSKLLISPLERKILPATNVKWFQIIFISVDELSWHNVYEFIHSYSVCLVI